MPGLCPPAAGAGTNQPRAGAAGILFRWGCTGAGSAPSHNEPHLDPAGLTQDCQLHRCPAPPWVHAKIEEDINERDYQDMHREHSPLVQAEDAVLVDSSEMTIDEVVEKILSLARERM